jgi:hypothetical protein
MGCPLREEMREMPPPRIPSTACASLRRVLAMSSSMEPRARLDYGLTTCAGVTFSVWSNILTSSRSLTQQPLLQAVPAPPRIMQQIGQRRAARHAALSLATAVMVTRRKGGKATLTWLMRMGGRGSRLFCVFGVADKRRKHRYPSASIKIDLRFCQKIGP